jgi:hypothetical protein
MSIWPVLIIGVLVGVFTLRRETGRKLFEGSRRRPAAPSNKEELSRSLDALIDFLSKHEQFRWAEHLRSVRADLQTPKETQALSRLSEFFGGMGSLNDLVFEGAGADSEAGRLMDAVFRDMKIYHGGTEHRVQWAKLAAEHKGDLPPRIKHAFSKE